jgi:diaminopimelate decarboxylase
MDVERILAATEGISTPVAVVDEEVVERNLARMAKLAADNCNIDDQPASWQQGYDRRRRPR